MLESLKIDSFSFDLEVRNPRDFLNQLFINHLGNVDGREIDGSSEVSRESFCTWLKAKREEAGLSHLDVAVILDCAYPAAVSKIGRGTTALLAHDLKLWSKALRVNQTKFGKQFAYHCHPFLYECLWASMSSMPRNSLARRPSGPRLDVGARAGTPGMPDDHSGRN